MKLEAVIGCDGAAARSCSKADCGRIILSPDSVLGAVAVLDRTPKEPDQRKAGCSSMVSPDYLGRCSISCIMTWGRDFGLRLDPP